MARAAVRTDRTDCPRCLRRVILAAGVPPLDYVPDPAGTVAAKHLAGGAWQARRWNPGDVLIVPEKRYAVHECSAPYPAQPPPSPHN